MFGVYSTLLFILYNFAVRKDVVIEEQPSEVVLYNTVQSEGDEIGQEELESAAATKSEHLLTASYPSFVKYSYRINLRSPRATEFRQLSVSDKKPDQDFEDNIFDQFIISSNQKRNRSTDYGRKMQNQL